MTNQVDDVRCTRGGLRLDGKGRPRDADLDRCLEIIDRSGLSEPLQALMDNTIGRPRVLNDVRGVLTAFLVNGATRHHRARIIEVARCIDAMTPEQRRRIGLERWNHTQGHDWLCRFLTWLTDTLDRAHTVDVHGTQIQLDAEAFMLQLLWASIPDDFPDVRSVAVDGTAIEAWASLYGDPDDVNDDKADEGSGRVPHMRSRRPKGRSVLRIYGTDPNGRPQYTKDPDARGGHRTATNSRRGGQYIGYELHLAVAARHVTSTDGAERISLSDPIPRLIFGANLVPAGTHKGASVLPLLRFIKSHKPSVDEVIVDAGYSRSKAKFFHHPVRQAGYDITFDVMLEQRGIRPFAGAARSIDGGFFSPLVPQRLEGRDAKGDNEPFPVRGYRVSPEDRALLEKPFNERARFAFVRHERPDADGSMRLRCPFHARRLRARQVPLSMRAAHTVPLVHLDRPTGPCCSTKSGVITVPAADAVLWQRIPFGTTAFYESYGRRLVVESVNGALKCQYINMDDRFTNIFGLTKLRVLFSFSLAGYNLDQVASFGQRNGDKPRPRAKRRRGTWHV